MENKCEHELNLVFENWFGENSLRATLECQKCKAKFEGLLFKDG